jgi:hypothetical protein
VECLFSDVQAAAAAAAQFLDKHSRCAIAEVDSHHGLQLLGVALVRIAAVRNYLGGRQLVGNSNHRACVDAFYDER